MTSSAGEMCFRVYLVHVVSILSLVLEHAEACEAIFNQNCLLSFLLLHGSQEPLIEEAGQKSLWRLFFKKKNNLKCFNLKNTYVH